MARVKRGNVARKRRNKILRLAKGFRGGNGTLFRTANQRVMKALCNAYRDRRKRKYLGKTIEYLCHGSPFIFH